MSNLSDLLLQTYTCLTSTVASMPTDEQPAHVIMAPGTERSGDMSQFEDQCCEGLAFVRMARTFASADFPNEDADPIPPCGPYAVAAVIEVGIIRCAPVGTADYMPSDDAWNAAAVQSAKDNGYLFSVMCCVRDLLESRHQTSSIFYNDWMPTPVEGGCVGSRIQFTVQMECPNNDC